MQVLKRDVACAPQTVHSANQANKTLRRLGFPPVPLTCVVITAVRPLLQVSAQDGLSPSAMLAWPLGLLALVLLKLLVHRYVVAVALADPGADPSSPLPASTPNADLQVVRSPLDRAPAQASIPLESVERFTMISRIT